jgi:tetratricopeptide (TPR) repeat protein
MNGEEAFKRGKEFYEQKEYLKAIACLDKALDDDDFDACGSAYNIKGIIHRILGEYEKAIDCFEKALGDEKYDRHGYVWNNKGNVYDNLGKYEDAIKCYNKAIQFDLDDAGKAAVHNNIGEASYRFKKPIDAEKEFREAIRLNSNLADPHYNLGVILTDEESYKDAEKEYERALKFKRDDADYLNGLGYVLWNLGDRKTAKEKFEEAIVSDITHSKAHRNLGALKKISETKYKMPALVRYVLVPGIAFILISAYYLLCADSKLISGSEFVMLIIFLTGLLTAIILSPEYKNFKVGPSGVELSRADEGKPIPKPAEPMMPPEILASPQS